MAEVRPHDTDDPSRSVLLTTSTDVGARIGGPGADTRDAGE